MPIRYEGCSSGDAALFEASGVEIASGSRDQILEGALLPPLFIY
jgi:hypothetical protein